MNSSIAENPFKLQIDRKILRPEFNEDEPPHLAAAYWAKRARQLLPSADITIIDESGGRYEVAK